MEKPKVICLCGSTRFKKEFERVNYDETLKGNIILTVGCFGHADGVEFTEDQKTALDELHKRKIDIADEILVINVDGYIGSSTKSEIEYAKKENKGIRYYE